MSWRARVVEGLPHTAEGVVQVTGAGGRSVQGREALRSVDEGPRPPPRSFVLLCGPTAR
jgi:hypothetical protein